MFRLLIGHLRTLPYRQAALALATHDAAMQAAAAAARMPVVDGVSVPPHQGGGDNHPPCPPDFLELTRQRKPNQCREALMSKKRAEPKQQQDLAAHALEPGSNMLSVEGYMGQGTFGGVTKATCKATGKTWAIKRAVDVSKFDATMGIVDDAQAEPRCPRHRFELGLPPLSLLIDVLALASHSSLSRKLKLIVGGNFSCCRHEVYSCEGREARGSPSRRFDCVVVCRRTRCSKQQTR